MRISCGVALMGRLSCTTQDYTRGPDVITRVLTKGGSRVRVRGEDGEGEAGVTCYCGWERQQNGSSLELPEERQSPFYANSLETSDFQNWKKINMLLLAAKSVVFWYSTWDPDTDPE